MSLADFTKRLFLDGQAKVAHQTSAGDFDGLPETIREWEFEYRQGLPGTPPSLHFPAACFGVWAFHELCRLSLNLESSSVNPCPEEWLQTFEERGVEVVRDSASLHQVSAERLMNADFTRTDFLTHRGPAVHYSFDITLRFIPELNQRLQHAAAYKSFQPLIVELSRRWPLSTVGIHDSRASDVSEFIHDSCLRRTYADRIIKHGQTARLGTQIVDDEVRRALGGHPNLAPRLAQHFDQSSSS